MDSGSGLQVSQFGFLNSGFGRISVETSQMVWTPGRYAGSRTGSKGTRPVSSLWSVAPAISHGSIQNDQINGNRYMDASILLAKIVLCGKYHNFIGLNSTHILC